MIRFDNSEPYIKPYGLKFREGQDPNIKLPKVAIGVFSRYLYKDIVEKFSTKEVGCISGANLERDVYIINYKGTLVTLFMAGVSGAWITADMEELHCQGVEKFIIFGNCGILDSKIEDCSIIIPTMAYREDGASYHYVPESDTILMNPKYVDDFTKILKEYNFNYIEAPTWTTDAFYRETVNKLKKYQELGVKTVEMEGASIAAVCQYMNVDYFTFYYAGDNLDSVEWDERSLSGLINIDKKKEVAILALELALVLDKKN